MNTVWYNLQNFKFLASTHTSLYQMEQHLKARRNAATKEPATLLRTYDCL